MSIELDSPSGELHTEVDGDEKRPLRTSGYQERRQKMPAESTVRPVGLVVPVDNASMEADSLS